MRRKLISEKGSIASVLINVGTQVALSIATGIKLGLYILLWCV